MSSYKELVFFSSIFFFIARRNLLCISLKKEWKQFWRTWKLSFASIAKNTATVDAAIYFAAATQILFDVLIHWPQSVVVSHYIWSQHAAVERRWANAQITGMLFIQPVLLHWKKIYISVPKEYWRIMVVSGLVLSRPRSLKLLKVQFHIWKGWNAM